MADSRPPLPFPTRVESLQVTRSKYSFGSAAPPPDLRGASEHRPARPLFSTADRMVPMFPHPRRAASAPSPSSDPRPRESYFVKTNVEQMMGRTRTGALPPYDPLGDPALSAYWMRKFGWALSGPGLANAGPRPRSAGQGTAEGAFPGAASGRGAHVYHVTVATGERTPAGSPVPRYITLEGAKGTSGRVALRGPFNPRSSVTCPVTTDALGPLRSIKLEHAGKSQRDAWYVEHVVVRTPKGKSYTFECEQWLSAFHGDQRLARVLTPNPASLESASGNRARLAGGSGGNGGDDTLYEIEVHTGDRRHAGTDANVFVTLRGSKGSSARVPLEAPKAAFERNGVDRFAVSVGRRIGKLTGVLIEHDNSGLAPGWFLDRVVCTHRATGHRYVLSCNQWLAADEGDRKFARELRVDSAGGIVAYTIEVWTGSQRGAGTDANVSVQLFGASGESAPFRLDRKRRDDFRRGAHDVFEVEAVSVGPLQRLRVGHDDSGVGASWFLHKVVVTDAQSGVAAVFPCDRWLAKDEDDGQITRMLVAQGADGAAGLGSFGGITYLLHVTTSDVMFAATSATVHATLYGAKGDSGIVLLDNDSKNFSRGRTDTFRIECSDLGELTHMKLGHDNSGAGSDWHVARVQVECPSLGKLFAASVDAWFAPSKGDGLIVRDIAFDPTLTKAIEAKSGWVCRVKTGTLRGAGTNSKVYMTVYGGKKHAPEILLNNKSDNFENGAVDTFKFDLEPLGSITKIRIRHDNAGALAAWYVESVELEDVGSGGQYRFDLNAWLSRREGDGEIVREAAATGPRVKAPLKLKKYRVVVHTGSKRGAGTDAHVFLSVSGSLGDTGKRELRNSDHLNKFERSQADAFEIDAVDLGQLEKLRIGHDNHLGGAAWFLDKVVVTDPDTGVVSVFPCGRWLARNEDDGRIERELTAVGADGSRVHTTAYRVSVFTGDVSRAGTDANVSLTLYGDKDDSGDVPLAKSETFSNKFERNHCDIFRIDAVDLGDIKKIRIGHDGRGASAGWFLDRVEVEAASLGKRYVFKCGRWFATSEDDGAIVREILADSASVESFAAHNAFDCTVTTGDELGAGTNSGVFMVVYGSTGKTPTISLRSKSDDFERAVADVFRLELADVGAIFKIRIWQDDKGVLGAAWLLQSVVLHQLATGRKLYFLANTWLSKKAGLVAELPVAKIEEMQRGALVVVPIDRPLTVQTYRVSVTTGKKMGAGTDANVFIMMSGEFGDSGERALASSASHVNKWERGNTDVFVIPLVDLGALSKIKIWHDGTGPGAGWFLDNVTVEGGSLAAPVVFPCNRWLAEDEDDRKIMRELGPQSSLPVELQTKHVATKYHLAVHTSDIKHAGTNANVFCTLYGKNGDTGVVPLTKSQNRNKWERKQRDDFVIEAIDLGVPTQLKVWTDGTGIGAGWHLEKIVVDVPLLGQTVIFPCGRWLASDEDDGRTERVLAPAAEAAVAYTRKAPYEVVVYTSDVAHAGTDANIFMDVYGRTLEGTEVTDHVVFKTAVKSSFERGSVDRFNFEMNDFGTPFKIRVGHDNKGIGAAWHLHKVVIIHQGTHVAWEFLCDRWFAKGEDDGKVVRELPVTQQLGLAADGSVAERAVSLQLVRTYTISVHTGTVSGAGTDANVFVTMFGQNGDTGVVPLAHSNTHINKFENGQCDVFTCDAVDLGELNSLKVWHDSKGFGAAWYLDHIDVSTPATTDAPPLQWTFPCNNWIGKSKEDLCRVLPVHLDATLTARLGAAAAVAAAAAPSKSRRAAHPGGAKEARATEPRLSGAVAPIMDAAGACAQHSPPPPPPSVVTYNVAVFTGSVSGAGTDANVFVTVTGEFGDSGIVPLAESSTHRNKFENGQKDEFSFQFADLGELVSLKVWHDAKGFGAAWYLERIDVSTVGAPSRKWTFPCNNWIDKSKEDLCRVLPVHLDADMQADIAARAARAADARVKAGRVHRPSESSAPTAKTAARAGAMRARSDAAVAAVLEEDEDKDEDEMEADDGNDDVSAEPVTWAARRAAGSRDASARGPARKHISADRAGAETAASLVASAHSIPSPVLDRKSSPADASGALRPARSSIVSAAFSAKTAATDRPLKVYEVSVTTGSESGAGTDADISLVMFGALGDSGEQKLARSATHTNKFEAGHTDVFTVQCADLGLLSKIRVTSTGKGALSSWFLDRVDVVEVASTSHFAFACGKWLSAKHGDRQLTRELVCSADDVKSHSDTYCITVTTCAEPGSGSTCDVLLNLAGDLNEAEIVLPRHSGDEFAVGRRDEFRFPLKDLGAVHSATLALKSSGAEMWTPKRLLVVNTRTGREASFDVTKKVGARPVTVRSNGVVEGGALATRRLEPVVYEVTVRTSTATGAGTDANVFITIFGVNGDSGKRALVKSKTHTNKFESGQDDVFDIECLDLGKLEKVVVSHDNKGLGAAWHLDCVMVAAPACAAVPFPCHAWLDSKSGLERVLIPATGDSASLTASSSGAP